MAQMKACNFLDPHQNTYWGQIGKKSDIASLKALDTFSNCRRPVFSLGVSQHKTVQTCDYFDQKIKQENNERKTPLLHKLMIVCAYRCPKDNGHVW